MVKVVQYTIIENDFYFFVEGNNRALTKREIETLLGMGLVNLSQKQYEQIVTSR
ncbi:hypothetical protein [Sulfurimonas sp.]|uniref:hypothetical protein n=1 Tax=Sulfurimonas sp. TaxID=2022749 RepID=UPI0025CE0A5C|nr:hypothetical protein [Sulfurimonas sp.]MBW6487517.1 hypothetical protein [Sulfurimonas sp.]